MLQIYKIIRDKQVNFIKKMIENEIKKLTLQTGFWKHDDLE